MGIPSDQGGENIAIEYRY